MSAEFDSFTNRGEYLAAHYFAEQMRTDLAKGLFDTWAMREGDDRHMAETPRESVRKLRGEYLKSEVRTFFAESTARDADAGDDARVHTHGTPGWIKTLTEWHRRVLRALGFADGSQQLSVHRAGREHLVEVAWHGEGIVALDCGWASLTDSVLDAGGPGRLLHPLRVSASESYETGAALASWLFGSELGAPGGDPPRFVLLLCGGVVMLADRQSWAEGRFLAANLDTALERNDRRQLGELATIAALFSHDLLAPRKDGKGPLIDTLLHASTNNAVGVTGELRDGLQRSVEIIANEVLARLDAAGVEPAAIENRRMPFARELTRETLRYLYRVLFLLYAEARPELGILPSDDASYEAGYSVARLRDLVERDEQLVEEEARNGFHLFESLNLLFRKVNEGHRYLDDGSEDDALPGEDRGLRFEPLRSELFEPKSIRLIGTGVDVGDHPLDLRLRNAALHEVLRLLTKKKGARRSERGGFISYRNLGINQLGAVYEGLMSYTGIIAAEELCEVAKRGEPEKGSWLIPAHRQSDYPENTLVTYNQHDIQRGLRGPKRYRPGTFVYRLAGRDRETSASYYTPESLTKVTVELTLKHRLDQETGPDGKPVRTRAAELLHYTICEPALGSGAFLNEAINQVAEEYLRRRQDELGISITAADALTEKQRVKAYIALHNAYGVDLNATGVELAEVSLWLNTMHPGMQAPWFGLHLRRGNSLIGGRRAVYSGKDLLPPAKEWLKAKGGLAPTPLPFPTALPDGAVHQFLLPSPGWAAVAGSAEAKKLAEVPVKALASWKKGFLQRPTKKQYDRLRGAARRVEYLWKLVARRMEISEGAIARRIPVWGADPADPEFAFLQRSQEPVAKEQVFADLFHAVDAPYWRLKKVMDAWCALWFWPVGSTGLLDGTDSAYTDRPIEQSPAALRALLTQAAPEQEIVHEVPALFTVTGEQLSLADAQHVVVETERARPLSKPKKVRPVRRAVIPLVELDDWLDFLESMLGTDDVPGKDSLIDQFETLDQLTDYEDQLPGWMGMDVGDPEQRFPWLHEVREIADAQGFLHWELEFARVFTESGGFDLQVGNPPWVRPRWNEDAVLAEHEPWFELEDKASTTNKVQRREELLASPAVLAYVLGEQTSTSAQVALLGSPQIYPLLAGTQPDLYRAFMCQTWDHSASVGTVGLVHPDTHFTGDKEGRLRAAAYRRLRIHGDFVNSGQRFFPEPVGHTAHFGVHIYKQPSDIDFEHLSWLVSVDAFRYSADDDGSSEVPGIRYLNAEFDERPHKKRVVRVNPDLLAVWQRLLGETDVPIDQARLLFPVSTAEAAAIEALANYPVRLSVFAPQISSGYHESGAKKADLIDYNRLDAASRREYQPDSWRRVVLKGTQLSVATPIFKRHDANSNDPYGTNLADLPPDFVPDTEYVRPPDRSAAYIAAQDRWIDHRTLARLRNDKRALVRARQRIAEADGIPESQVDPSRIDALLINRARRRYSSFHRIAWREMIAPNTERSFYPALLPPGPAHTHGVRSAWISNNRTTALMAGLCAGLPMDYLLRATGTGHLDVGRANGLPAVSAGHPLESALLIRTLRLNCLTTAYSRLWAELYDHTWPGYEGWALEWPGLQPLHDVGPSWRPDTPLRSERARRSALVEIDALVAVWLGMDAEALIAAYKGRFPVLQKYEAVTWFDVDGWKLAGNARTIGQLQTKQSWAQFQAHLADPNSASPPEGYTAPFHKADREREMREAHAVFQARLDAAVARGEWDPITQEVPHP
ncbi:class I SAM-dependent DNA methyltransferase [Pseudonocardia sp. GCM10023141]|uniref:class I SAM-dependent DNA methyltransferase n=1 Tax=Pseudonocardia sp. GCM10023141 TaxID=3252653 RepID=UPI003605CF03